MKPPKHVAARGLTWLECIPPGTQAELWDGRLVLLLKLSPGGAYVRYPDDGTRSIIARQTEVRPIHQEVK